jgi:hypothetical protein
VLGSSELYSAENYSVPEAAQIILQEPIKVVARIRAQGGLNQNQLSLFWKKEGSSTFQKVKMMPINGGIICSNASNDCSTIGFFA